MELKMPELSESDYNKLCDMLAELAPCIEGMKETPAKFVQDSSDFVMQLYEDNEWKEEKMPDVVMNGETVPGQIVSSPTGRQVKRLRCTYHPNYAARFRADWRVVPEYIEAPSPEERYAAFLEVAAGRRTKWGHYPAAPA